LPLCGVLAVVFLGLDPKKEATKLKPKLAIHKELIMFVPTPEQQYAT
jgi:hypothetical protein